jgi:hypothetical protein
MIEIYRASVQNVRELKKQRTNLRRLFNKAIIKHDNPSLNVITKLYALLYSSFAEVCFLKMIHTPYGFSETFITEIFKQRNLEEQWLKSIECAFSQVLSMPNKGEIQNKKQILIRHLNKYIIEPSQIRNKIAHGQWAIALNSENTKINRDTTTKIASLDFVKVDILFEVYEKIAQAVEDLIESPHKTHFRDFYLHMSELEDLIDLTKGWTTKSKIKKLEETLMRQRSNKPLK